MRQDDPAGVLFDAACADASDKARTLIRNWPSVPVVMLADESHAGVATRAVREGAIDYAHWPLAPEELRATLDKADAHAARYAESPPPSQMSDDAGILGDGIAMKKLLSQLRRAARGESTVLVQGESGSGKELIARQIHMSSPRSHGPFVKVHCGALPDNLLESELFGYEKGAFTGAEARKLGRVELAQGGSLFLDEIGDISPAVQVKLLGVLQDRAYERLGGTETIEADVRFISATHRDLKRMVKDGTFREDLFYRLNVVRLVAPPLRSRREDIPILVDRFLTEAAQRNKLDPPTLDSSALEALGRYSWPGNVRQLQHVVERLVVMSEVPTLTAAAVEEELTLDGSPPGTIRGVPTTNMTRNDAVNPEPTVQELAMAIRLAERKALDKALSKAGRDRNMAARLLGISRRKLFYMLKQHAIT
jgi:two-component system response regulator AtoC